MKAFGFIFISIFSVLVISCSYYYRDKQLTKKLVCKKKYELTLDERKNQLQIKDTPKIAFASFKKGSNITTSDLEMYFEQIRKDFSKFDLKDFYEVKFLNYNEIESFSDLIYNYGINKETEWERDLMCYEPHNAILFLNEDNTLKGFIEICFDCNKYYSSNQGIYNLGEYCETKLDFLKEEFINIGITYVGDK